MNNKKRFIREEDSDYVRDNVTDERVLYVVDFLDTMNELNDSNHVLYEEVKLLWTEIMLRSPVGGWQNVIRESKKRIGDLE